MEVARGRRLWWFVPHADGRRGLAVGDETSATMPSVDIETAPGESTAAAATRWLASIGLDPWLVDCVVDQVEETELDGELREAMAVAESPPSGWAPPPGWVWRPWSDIVPRVAPGIEPACRQRLAEWRGDAAAPSERSAWARPGWYPRARAWIESSLAAAGWPPPTDVAPVRNWGTSLVMRVETERGPCWFKATSSIFRAEPAITRTLQPLSAGATPAAIAVDTERFWMLLDDLGTTEVTSDDDQRAAVDTLVALQVQLVDHRDPLERAGCRHRPLAELADAFDAALAAPLVREFAEHGWARRAELGAGVRAALDIVAAWDLPEVCVHGDFHPGNTAATEHGIVIFDWSDAAFSVPVVDAVTWAWWYDDDAERTDRIWTWFAAAWEREFGLDPTRFDRVAAEAVAAAYHVISYVELLGSLEAIRRAELADGLTQFVDVVDRAVR